MGSVRNGKVAKGAYVNNLENYTHRESVGVSLVNLYQRVYECVCG